MKVDMHFHTNHSDGAATVDQVLEKIRELKIGVAITDHNEISGSLEAFAKKKEIDFIIPGIEVKSKEMVDILFYFYDLQDLKVFFEKEILPFRKVIFYQKSWTTRPLREIVNLRNKYKCLVCVPHAFGYSLRTGRNDIFEKNEKELSKIEIYEAINGGTDLKNNQRAQEYIKKNKKKFTAGSDGHSIHRLGKVYTESDAATVKGLLDSIKSGKAAIYGEGTNKFHEYFNWFRNKVNI